MDVHGMISSSLASVIRQSLNPDFRKECYLLLGVTNNRDAQGAIYSQLKLRGSNATEKRKNPTEKRNDDGPQKVNTEREKQVPEQTHENIDCNLSTTLVHESHNVSTPAQDILELSKDPSVVHEPHNVSTPAQDILEISKDRSVIQEIKSEPIDSEELAQSDDESQLDWDTDM